MELGTINMNIYIHLLLHPRKMRNTMLEYIEQIISNYTLEGYKGALKIHNCYLEGVKCADGKYYVTLRLTKERANKQSVGAIALDKLTNRELLKLNKVLVKAIYL